MAASSEVGDEALIFQQAQQIRQPATLIILVVSQNGHDGRMVVVGVGSPGDNDLGVAERRAAGVWVAPVERADPSIAESDDLAMAAVVGGQAVGCGVGKALLEGDESIGVGAAEAVQQLVLITDHADVAVHISQAEEDLLLGEVGVLVLVHQQVVNVRSQMVRQTVVPQQQQGL